MKVVRAGVHLFASVIVCLGFAAPAALADVRPLEPTLTLPRPASPTYTNFGAEVAIDGGHIVVLAGYPGTQRALHYRRSASTGQWTFRRVIETYSGSTARWSVAMRNGIAAVQIDDRVSIFEIVNGDYVRATSAAPIVHHGGVAISGDSVLIGGNNCNYDAVIYQKGSDGRWSITGRLDDNQGECVSTGVNPFVELNYNYALTSTRNSNVLRAWRRNGTAVDWVPAGTITLAGNPGDNPGLQGATAVAPNGEVWRRSGTATWTSRGKVIGVDRDDANPGATTFSAVFRDGVLITNESSYWRPQPHVYVEVSPGQFEHVATMVYANGTGAISHDVSGRTAVVSVRDYDNSRQLVHIYNLPSPLRVPAVAANDFEDRNVSDISFSGTPFTVTARGTDDVLAQSSNSGFGLALFNGTDWTDQQRVEADVTPNLTGSAGGWVGLVARYVDADNYYYLALRETSWALYKRVNGIDTLLVEEAFYNSKPPSYRATLRAIGNQISTHFSFQQGRTVVDNSLTHGSAGVATSFARADFDDVIITPTEWFYWLFSRDWGATHYQSDMQHIGGDWVILEGGDEETRHPTGLSQRSTSGDARSIIGTPVQNQDIRTIMRVDGFGSSGTGAWVGVLARYVDANNHYYVTARDNGKIEIRKKVNGVITVLASANYPPGQTLCVRFLVANDQLQLWLGDVMVASAHDRDIARGQYGLATYRAAANFLTLTVLQP